MLNSKASRPADDFELVEEEVAEFALVADDDTEAEALCRIVLLRRSTSASWSTG
jgi:hypothetical protein